MKQNIRWTFDEGYYYIIKEYIDFNYIDAPEKDREKLTQTALTLYLYLKEKSIDKKSVDILAKTLMDNFRPLIKSKRLNYIFILAILKGAGLINREEGRKGYLTKSYIKNQNIQSNPKSKSIYLNDMTDILFRKNLEMDFDMDKLLNYEIKPQNYWTKLYKGQKSIIKMIYETYYDIDEVKDFVKSKIGTPNKKGKIITTEMAADYINRAQKYNKRIYNFVLTPEGRLYNPASIQPSTIRHLLKWKGEYLLEMDITNSQPLLLTLFVKNEKYKKAVEGGTFYEEVSKYLNIDRERAKVFILKYIFYGDYKLEKGKIHEMMEALYPGFLDELKEIKKNHILWKSLQTAEAEIIMKLGGEYISIHDAILIKKIDLELYYNKIVSIFKAQNINPKIKITQNETTI